MAVWRLALLMVALAGVLGCGTPIRPTETPAPAAAEDEEPLLTAALDELRLGSRVVDPGARCIPATPTAKPPLACPGAPPELELDAPELHDARPEPNLSLLWSRDRYHRVIAQLEGALVRSHAHTRARRKILGWLVSALDRLRVADLVWEAPDAPARQDLRSPCLAHYLALLAQELGPRRPSALVRYVLAVEREHAGAEVEALASYGAISQEERGGSAFTAAQVALGDAAFRSSFCDESRLSEAARHYLIATHGRSPRGVPLVGYARVRLAQVDERLGAFAPALDELERAEIEGIDPGLARYFGPRLLRTRRLLENTLASIARRSVRGGTLRLLFALQPPNGSMCSEIARLEKHLLDSPDAEEIASAMSGPCHWQRDPGQECVATTGCTLQPVHVPKPFE